MRDLATHQILEEQYGRPTYIGTIAVGTATKSNADTTIPFTINPGSRLMLQVIGSVNVFIRVGPSGTTSFTTGAVSLSPLEKFYTCLLMTDSVVAGITASGVGSLNVFLME
jgi:hypothetical protein